MEWNVCTYVRTYVCMYACMYVCVCIYIYGTDALVIISIIYKFVDMICFHLFNSPMDWEWIVTSERVEIVAESMGW